MDLYFIRHGETVDNVAGLYAGVRDSALTNHGHQQAQRLSEHFANHFVVFSHVFSSPLSRALKTAQAISSSQSMGSTQKQVDIVQVQDLIEQDFGYYEGKPFHARSNPRKTGRDTHLESNRNKPGFVDVESKGSLDKRANSFLEQHLFPLLTSEHDGERRVVAIVSHGMLLGRLWKMLLLRLPARSVAIAPEVTVARGSVILEHLGGWSNTGYLELALDQASEVLAAQQALPSPRAEAQLEPVKASTVAAGEEIAPTPITDRVSEASKDSTILTGWSTLVRAIDSKEHLVGLKRQRGGIGRSAYDDGQKKLDGFFKRRRIE